MPKPVCFAAVDRISRSIHQSLHRVGQSVGIRLSSAWLRQSTPSECPYPMTLRTANRAPSVSIYWSQRSVCCHCLPKAWPTVQELQILASASGWLEYLAHAEAKMTNGRSIGSFANRGCSGLIASLLSLGCFFFQRLWVLGRDFGAGISRCASGKGSTAKFSVIREIARETRAVRTGSRIIQIAGHRLDATWRRPAQLAQ